MSAHTEGPWVFVPGVQKGYFKRYSVDSHSDWGIATCAAGLPGGEDETRANARLIASAPELLEALQLVVAKLGTDFELYREQAFAIDVARAAISKATGDAA